MIAGVDDVTAGATLDDLRRYARLGRKRASVGLARVRLGLAPSPRPLDEDRALGSLPSDPHVLFVCLGNICRSPMAERYLRAGLRDRGLEGFTVESAGFIDAEDRPSPDDARRAAREFGVDLADHGSTRLTDCLLATSDLVLLMDAYNYALLGRQFGNRLDRAYFLGAFDDGNGYEIADPNGTDLAEFQRVYGRIADALDAFLARVAEGQSEATRSDGGPSGDSRRSGGDRPSRDDPESRYERRSTGDFRSGGDRR